MIIILRHVLMADLNRKGLEVFDSLGWARLHPAAIVLLEELRDKFGVDPNTFGYTRNTGFKVETPKILSFILDTKERGEEKA
jgi:hypothetical protein